MFNVDSQGSLLLSRPIPSPPATRGLADWFGHPPRPVLKPCPAWARPLTQTGSGQSVMALPLAHSSLSLAMATPAIAVT